VEDEPGRVRGAAELDGDPVALAVHAAVECCGARRDDPERDVSLRQRARNAWKLPGTASVLPGAGVAEATESGFLQWLKQLLVRGSLKQA
jgi:hypothetical protein